MAKRRLREGFTTGSAAAAGAKAGILCLAGKGLVRDVDIPLPVGGRLTIPVSEIAANGNSCTVTVIKDGGDDPDATHKARIISHVRLLPEGVHGDVIMKGGKGVGKVTRPGLPVPVGESAINPVPRQQITEAVREGLRETGLRGAVSVTIEVTNGEKIAKKTLNPRLGIVGGISILGTRGTVKPFSNKAYTATITLSMDVARAAGLSTIALATGGRSERFLKELWPNLPEMSFIQVADFFSFSLKEAVKKGFTDVLYSCFFGKLVKMAQGYPYTHARKSRIDFSQLSGWCATMGIDEEKAQRIATANTAREALSIIKEEVQRDKIIPYVMEKAISSARGFAGPGPDISYYLFDFEGEILAHKREKGGNSEN
ncbi:MAG: cobalt-precorrin-5B (C(1))-methyltransferase [Deltaproteobacteria bacterium]|nr:cobalt-precorrin-5B (C(1))-methyltransferase [Deltaproteobacteria bacterium]